MYNLPYEQVGKNEPVCIAEEVQFEIPDSWEWVRLGSIIELQSGQDMPPDNYNATMKGIPYLTGASNIESGKVIINRWTEHGRAFAYQGDILLTCKGTVGAMAILNEPQVHIARQIMAVRPSRRLNTGYILLVLDSLVNTLKAAAKSMIPGISREDVLLSLVALPPKCEQDRICKRYEALKPALQKYQIAYKSCEQLDTAFPAQLKKSILQQAVQGKLVPQDPADEPASVLLERIRAEKKQLIRSRKIKRDKHESVIYRRDKSHYEKVDSVEHCIDDEIPFEIPESWEWVRFSQICTILNGDRGKNYPSKSSLSTTGIPFISALNLDGKSVVKDERLLCLSEDQYAKLGNGKLCKGDIVICIRGSLGKHGVYPFEMGAIASSLVIARPFYDDIFLSYIMIFLDSPLFYAEIKQFDNGTAQPNLAAKSLEQFFIPLPPKQEQRRIVEKMDELFPTIDCLQ